MRRAVWVSVVILTIIALMAAGCGPARQPSAGTQTGGGETFMVALPRMVVDVDDAGSPVLFGINASQLGRFLGSDFSSLQFPPSTVASMKKANIQHIEVRQVGDAAVFLVNGKPMPHIGWSDQSLQQAVALIPVASPDFQNADVYARLLPLVRRLGLDLVLRFPRAGATPEIALANPDQAVTLSPSTDLPSAIAYMEVKYDKDGVPGVMGISAADLARIGISLRARLEPSLLLRLQENNVQNVELRSKNDGVYVYVNGSPLPNLVWDASLLQNLTDLYSQFNPDDPNLAIMQLLIPFLGRADVDILLHLPVAPGQQTLPATMHP